MSDNQPDIDSDSFSVGELIKLARDFRDIDARKGAAFAHKAVSMAKEHEDEHALARSELELGRNLRIRSDTLEAVERLESAATRFEALGDRQEWAGTIYELGACCILPSPTFADLRLSWRLAEPESPGKYEDRLICGLQYAT